MASVIYSALRPVDGDWNGAVSALLERIADDDLISGAVIAVKVDLTAQDVPPTLVKADRKSTRLNSSHPTTSRMPSSA